MSFEGILEKMDLVIMAPNCIPKSEDYSEQPPMWTECSDSRNSFHKWFRRPKIETASHTTENILTYSDQEVSLKWDLTMMITIIMRTYSWKILSLQSFLNLQTSFICISILWQNWYSMRPYSDGTENPQYQSFVITLDLYWAYLIWGYMTHRYEVWGPHRVIANQKILCGLFFCSMSC